MDILHLLCCVSVAFTGLTSGAGVLPDGPLTAAVGGAAMFITTLTPPEQPFLSVSWAFNNNRINIITSTSANQTGPEYESRITLFRSTGSLELRNLTLNDSGLYTVSIIPDGGVQITGETTLEILEPVSSVTVTVSEADLVEFNSSVSLSCSSSGSSLAFLWLNGSSELTDGGRVQLSDANRNLTIVNVTRYDQGPFRCNVSNAVSTGTSDPKTLSISYGPENINLKTSPPRESCEKGSNITFSCSAVSRPSAQFHWFLNQTMLSETGPELRLTNVQMNQSGGYSCQAFNNKTLRYQTSLPSAVTVLALPELQTSTGCSAGCIAGIVVACVVVVVIACLLVYFISFNKKRSKQFSNRDAATRTGSEGQDNATFSQSQELHYAQVSFQNKNAGPVRLGSEDNSTPYAEIQSHRVNSPSSPPTYDAHMERMRETASQPGAKGAHGAQVHGNQMHQI